MVTYTLTVHIAAPGTPLRQGGTSLPGHMWYSLSDGRGGNPDRSYGFAPITHGSLNGPGRITDDTPEYINPFYSRTIQISQREYDKLREFGESTAAGENKFFNLEYKDVRNNCVDYTWAALRHAGIYKKDDYQPDKKFEGNLKPMQNVKAVRHLVSEITDSWINEEKINKLPYQTITQSLFTDKDKSKSPVPEPESMSDSVQNKLPNDQNQASPDSNKDKSKSLEVMPDSILDKLPNEQKSMLLDNQKQPLSQSDFAMQMLMDSVAQYPASSSQSISAGHGAQSHGAQSL